MTDRMQNNLNLNLQNRQSRRKHASSILKEMKTNQILQNNKLKNDEVVQKEIFDDSSKHSKLSQLRQSSKTKIQLKENRKYQKAVPSSLKFRQTQINLKEQHLGKWQVVKGANIMNENAKKLMSFICGGYQYDQYNNFLSLSQFNRCRENFATLNDLYQRVLSSNEARRLNSQKLTDHTLLAMVYVNENIGKMKKHEIQAIFQKIKVVW